VVVPRDLGSCPQTGGKESEAPHLNDNSSPPSVFLLYFAEIITLLVVETNRYYHDHLDRLDDGPSPQPDVTEAEMLVSLVITIQMGHCIRDKLTDYWSRAYNFHTPFYGNCMKQDRFFHIFRFLHFTDNKNEPDMPHENSDQLWKMRNLTFGTRNFQNFTTLLNIWPYAKLLLNTKEG